jgi:hypothetical protein
MFNVCCQYNGTKKGICFFVVNKMENWISLSH